MTVASSYSLPRHVRLRREGRGKGALIVLLALLYPWHFTIGPARYTSSNPPIPHGGLNFSLGDIVVAAISVIMLFQLAAGRVRLPRYGLQAFVWYTAAAVSVTVNALSPSYFFVLNDSVAGLVKIVAAMTWMVAVFWLLRESFPPRFLQLAGTLVVGAVAYAIWSIFQTVVLRWERSFGPFENANIYGNYMLLNVFLAVGLDRLLGEAAPGITLRRDVRAVLRPLIRFGAVPILILGLLTTGSRGAMVGFLVGLVPAVPWRALKRVSWRGVSAVVVGGLILGLALGWYFAQDPYVVGRWERTAEGRGPNVEERFELWEGAVEAFSNHPVLGIGYAQYPNYAAHLPGLRATVTHQTYLATAAELGALGFFALLWLLLSVIIDSWRVKERPFVGAAHACCAFVVAASAQGMFNNVQQERSLWLVFGMVAALLVYRRTIRSGIPDAAVTTRLR